MDSSLDKLSLLVEWGATTVQLATTNASMVSPPTCWTGTVSWLPCTSLTGVTESVWWSLRENSRYRFHVLMIAQDVDSKTEVRYTGRVL